MQATRINAVAHSTARELFGPLYVPLQAYQFHSLPASRAPISPAHIIPQACSLLSDEIDLYYKYTSALSYLRCKFLNTKIDIVAAAQIGGLIFVATMCACAVITPFKYCRPTYC